MERVFAGVRSPLEISVAVARTSQSPFPLCAILRRPYRRQTIRLKTEFSRAEQQLKIVTLHKKIFEWN